MKRHEKTGFHPSNHDIWCYYETGSDTPFMLDSRFVVGCDKVRMQKSRLNNGTSGLRVDQEFSVHWEKTPNILANNSYTVLKRLLMKERGIPDYLVRRIVTKFIDGNKRNMLSSNIVLAEVISVSNNVWNTTEAYQFNSRLNGTTVKIPKEDLMKMFKEHCKCIPHPLVLSLDGVLIARKGC